MKSSKGFTLVELLAVITIIGVLLTLATTAAVTTMNKGKKRVEKLSAKDYITAVNDYNFISNNTEKISTTNCNNPLSVPCSVLLRSSAFLKAKRLTRPRIIHWNNT